VGVAEGVERVAGERFERDCRTVAKLLPLRAMKAFEASATIQATPERIWEILADTPGYPDWDSGVVRIEGTLRPGEKIKVFSELNPGRGFPIKVTEITPPRSMTWKGGMPLGLFKGVRRYTLTPADGGATRFNMREEFTGPLLPLIWRTIPDMQPSFEQFASGLKARAERP
jgi:hypothetical protein